MPHFKCRGCHHEWDGCRNGGVCDWCGRGNPRVLEEVTSLERCIRELLMEGDLRPVPHPGSNPGEG